MPDVSTPPPAFAFDVSGEDYKAVLERLHRLLNPSSYLEIGSRDGSSLALANCPSIAIDPEFSLNASFLGSKPFCSLYRMGSDGFFAAFDPQTILLRKVDFAFLDGLHLAEFLLRDFINVERACKPNSVIAMHDCLPLDAPMARRSERGAGELRSERFPFWWTGDVWKVIPALKKYRPGLEILILDAQPTGLVLVTGLDPQSTVLTDHYQDIVREFRAMTDLDMEAFVRSIELHKTTALTSYEDVSKYFWF